MAAIIIVVIIVAVERERRGAGPLTLRSLLFLPKE
jgi:hypothetical protein